MNLNPGWLSNEKAEKFPHKTAVIYKGENLDFLTLNRRANRLAHVLSDLGVREGDKAGILFPNSPEFVVSYLAILKIGGVVVPFDTRVAPEEIHRMLDFVQASCLITLPSVIPCELEDKAVVHVEGETIKIQDRILDPPDSSMGLECDPDKEAVCLSTSGSTGMQKLAVLTLGNLSCFPVVMREIFAATPSAIYGMTLPMSHVSGPIIVQEVFETGTTLALINSLDGKHILQSIEKYGISLIWSVAPIYRLLANAAKKGGFDARSLKTLAVMGMETPLTLLKELSHVFPDTAIVQGYGLTETAGPIIGTLPKDAQRKLGSIGRPASFMEVKVVDDEGGDLPVGQAGEIIVKGPAVMKGYYNDPEATEKRIKNGWLYTGDIARFDEDGYLYMAGRKDDMIITGGLNVFPAEIEDVLSRHPEVKEAAVVGIPDEKRGQIVEAIIVPASDNVSKKEILEFCRENLAGYKCPRSIRFVSELPKTSTGKIPRSSLRTKKA